jgi:hypothetical protein
MLFIWQVVLTIGASFCNMVPSVGGAVVQLGERLTGSQEVGSSSLLSSTIFFVQ